MNWKLRKRDSKSLNPCCSGNRSRRDWSGGHNYRVEVLILVVVEIGLGAIYESIMGILSEKVLILVVVEIGLGETKREFVPMLKGIVLILVVVEIGLGDGHKFMREIMNTGLNPCCSGNRSRRIHCLD